MLIELSITNFASFRTRQTLSMVAAPQLRRRENTFVPDVPGEKLPRLLKAIAIYGPNASGKSNLLKAFEAVQKIASKQPDSANSKLPVQPFRFDPDLADKPSEFEVHFIVNKIRYCFELKATQERITGERLTAYPNGRESLLYSRSFDGTVDVYQFGELEGEEVLHEIWRKATSQRVLFISQAVANSNEELQQLREPFGWLTSAGMFVNGGLKHAAARSQHLFESIPDYAQSLQELLQEIDVPITKISVKRKPQEADLAKKPETSYKTTLTHTTALGSANFDLSEESEGTQNLIGFWLPWYVNLSLTNARKRRSSLADKSFGLILVVDELDASLHPSIIDALIKKYVSSNTETAQLIFTAHNTHLMDRKILRRDQFWLTERDAFGATQLRSVHDFKGRDSEDVEKRYFEGKYRSLPYISI